MQLKVREIMIAIVIYIDVNNGCYKLRFHTVNSMQEQQICIFRM